MADRPEITGTRLKVLEAIKDHLEEYGYPPTVRQICERKRISSTSTVSYHIRKLDEFGYIKRTPKDARGLKVL